MTLIKTQLPRTMFQAISPGGARRFAIDRSLDHPENMYRVHKDANPTYIREAKKHFHKQKNAGKKPVSPGDLNLE